MVIGALSLQPLAASPSQEVLCGKQCCEAGGAQPHGPESRDTVDSLSPFNCVPNSGEVALPGSLLCSLKLWVIPQGVLILTTPFGHCQPCLKSRAQVMSKAHTVFFTYGCE